jgi:hypothetical protein
MSNSRMYVVGFFCEFNISADPPWHGVIVIRAKLAKLPETWKSENALTKIHFQLRRRRFSGRVYVPRRDQHPTGANPLPATGKTWFNNFLLKTFFDNPHLSWEQSFKILLTKWNHSAQKRIKILTFRTLLIYQIHNPIFLIQRKI